MSNSVIPWTAAYQASLSFTVSWSMHKLMSIESVMPFNHLISLSKNEPQAKSILLGRGTGKGLPLGREEGKGEPAHGHQSSRKPPLGKVKSWLSCVTGHTVWTPCFFRLKFPSLRREQTFDILQESFTFAISRFYKEKDGKGHSRQLHL